MPELPDLAFAYRSRPVPDQAARLLPLARRGGTEAALLLSDGVHPLGRRSLLALWPFLEYRYRRGRAILSMDQRVLYSGVVLKPLRLLDRILERRGPPPPPGEFACGAVGFLGYDFGHELLGLPRRPEAAASPLPDLQFRFHRCHLAVDHGEHRTTAHLTGVGRTAAEAAGDLDRTEARLEHFLRGTDPATDLAPVPPRRPSLRLDRAAYLDRIRRIQRYIRLGHVYQVNFSHHFEMEWDEPGLVILERLFAVNPVPFAGWLPFPGGEVVSLSPECLLQRDGSRVATYPIKGTRPRGSNPAEDLRLAQDLLSSPKDGAELAMIVDLERNDLGKVCQPGTVRVTRHREVETYRTLHHTVSVVEGLLADVRPSAMLAALLPGGSVTGVPKRRCVEIIAELEEAERGIYTGAIGFISTNGDSVFSLAIRTLVKEGSHIRFRMGGGIVHASDPEAEYEETLHKARAFFLAAGAEMQ